MFFARVCISAERNIFDLSQKKVWRHSSSQPPVLLNLQEPGEELELSQGLASVVEGH